jgi:hypothetical protein
MITYKPINDIDKIKEIFDNSLINDKGIYGGYIGFDENDTSVGTCLVRIDSYKCYFIFIECDFSDKLLVEGFLRAGLNYCANRNAYMCYCEIEEISDVLTHLGFEYNNGVYSGDIPTLLKGSCCK